MTDPAIYAEPPNPALPDSGFVFDHRRAALVLTDPQIDFLSPDGVSWPVFGGSVRENDTVAHIGQLLDAAKQGARRVHDKLPEEIRQRLPEELRIKITGT